MTYNPDIHHRRSIRLKEYDYSQRGLYFVTLCTQNHECLFGIIVGAGSKPAPFFKHSEQTELERAGEDRAGEDRAGLEPAPTKPAMTIEHPPSMQNDRAGLEPAPTGIMHLNEYGVIVENTWNDLKNHNAEIKLHEFVVMPNHIHGIIEIVDHADKTKTLSEIVRQFKTFSAKRINKLRNTSGVSVWQRNYYEHIIRDEKSYQKISEYIVTNPLKWQEDKYFA